MTVYLGHGVGGFRSWISFLEVFKLIYLDLFWAMLSSMSK